MCWSLIGYSIKGLPPINPHDFIANHQNSLICRSPPHDQISNPVFKPTPGNPTKLCASLGDVGEIPVDLTFPRGLVLPRVWSVLELAHGFLHQLRDLGHPRFDLGGDLIKFTTPTTLRRTNDPIDHIGNVNDVPCLATVTVDKKSFSLNRLSDELGDDAFLVPRMCTLGITES